jgi:hypothetical protein
MAEQNSPHNQTEQNLNPAQTDLEDGRTATEEAIGAEAAMYDHMEGAQTGTNRAPEKLPPDDTHHATEQPQAAYEGSLETRTPKRPVQGITSRSAEEESARQEKVVNERPDAQAGVNHSK